jgi:hypothetical protein
LQIIINRKMSKSTSKVGPSLADSPADAPKTANVFDYNVSANAKIPAPAKPNPASPLAAG